jgi:hypothetical protein
MAVRTRCSLERSLKLALLDQKLVHAKEAYGNYSSGPETTPLANPCSSDLIVADARFFLLLLKQARETLSLHRRQRVCF